MSKRLYVGEGGSMDIQGFAAAYSQGLKRTIAFLISRGVSFDTAPDVAQAAWLRGWERLDQLRDEKMILPWIYVIALNDHKRNQRRQSREEALTSAHTHRSTTVLNWAAIDISTILSASRPKDRTLLQSQLRGESIRELARDQGVSEASIRIGLFRARRTARNFCESLPRSLKWESRNYSRLPEVRTADSQPG